MKTLFRIIAPLALCAFAATAHAHSYSIGDIQITHPWAKASLKGVPNSAAYITITNTGQTDDRLVAASADISDAVEMHRMTMKDGVMRMRRLEGGVPLPAGETVALAPGGKHIMLIGLKDRLQAGDSFDMTLSFQSAGEQEVEVPVRDRQPKQAEDAS